MRKVYCHRFKSYKHFSEKLDGVGPVDKITDPPTISFTTLSNKKNLKKIHVIRDT